MAAYTELGQWRRMSARGTVVNVVIDFSGEDAYLLVPFISYIIHKVSLR